MKTLLAILVLFSANFAQAQGPSLNKVCGHLEILTVDGDMEVLVHRLLPNETSQKNLRLSTSDYESLTLLSALHPEQEVCLEGYNGKKVGQDQLFFPVRVLR